MVINPRTTGDLTSAIRIIQTKIGRTLDKIEAEISRIEESDEHISKWNVKLNFPDLEELESFIEARIRYHLYIPLCKLLKRFIKLRHTYNAIMRLSKIDFKRTKLYPRIEMFF